MKFNMSEVFVMKSGVENISVKGFDCRMVADLLDKLQKEFNRLEKSEEK